MEVEIRLDVSRLEPPEPLVLTLAAATRLEPGTYLRMRHRRHPCLLHDNLSERGFASLTREQPDGGVEVFIWRQGDEAAAELARRAFDAQ